MREDLLGVGWLTEEDGVQRGCCQLGHCGRLDLGQVQHGYPEYPQVQLNTVDTVGGGCSVARSEVDVAARSA
jgi:hypothetical protein